VRARAAPSWVHPTVFHPVGRTAAEVDAETETETEVVDVGVEEVDDEESEGVYLKVVVV